MERQHYEGYEVSDIDVREHTDGSYYIGREINVNGNWHPHTIESQKFQQVDHAIKQYALMKTNDISKQVGERLGSTEYKPLPETKPIYYKVEPENEKAIHQPVIDLERSHEATHKQDYEREYEHAAKVAAVGLHEREHERKDTPEREEIAREGYTIDDVYTNNRDYDRDNDHDRGDYTDEELERLDEYIELSEIVYSKEIEFDR
ncbi:hypothetical protein [Priestia megaterium]|uniref:hypothetical protein n=1 Tax=Priestia megaterium TaxID=1404 RepID=UPI0031FCE83C